MGKIAVLDKTTIDKIAAGEVVERPASVVKELVENAIDAGASAITVEIKEGGISFLRITDNGSGIAAEDVKIAFLRHSTSKIKTVEDLLCAGSLGFRGEALSSISAVAQVELVTKTKEAFVGIRYVIEGGEEKEFEEVGCPDGTTFLVRNLFYNVPARRKFLKSAITEAGYINDLMARMALSHPEISFKFINGGKVILHTTGNNDCKELVYHIYGRDTAAVLLPVTAEKDGMRIDGLIGKPVAARGNRTYENYFINGRYIKSPVISRAIEDAYKPYLMQHKYPFTALQLTLESEKIDVNVHPAKLEVRLLEGDAVYQLVYHAVFDALSGRNMIPQVTPQTEKESRQQEREARRAEKKETVSVPEPFEVKRRAAAAVEKTAEKTALNSLYEIPEGIPSFVKEAAPDDNDRHPEIQKVPESRKTTEAVIQPEPSLLKGAPALKRQPEPSFVQEELPDLLREADKKTYTIIGQLFATYWLIEMEEQLFIIDQHAAHEKILYEQTMRRVRKKEVLSQQLSPSMIVSLSLREEEVFLANRDEFTKLGFDIEPFGGREYSITAVPADLCGISSPELFLQILDGLVDEKQGTEPEQLLEKVASLSCKAAIKGNTRLSKEEAKAMIDTLLSLENPYHCPHGRPTTIVMSRYEIEKKFKRIV